MNYPDDLSKSLYSRWQIKNCNFSYSAGSGQPQYCPHMIYQDEFCWYHYNGPNREPDGWPVYVIYSMQGSRVQPTTAKKYLLGVSEGKFRYPPLPGKNSFEAGKPFKIDVPVKQKELSSVEDEFIQLFNSGDDAVKAVMERHGTKRIVEYLSQVWLPKYKLWLEGDVPF